MKSSTAGTVKPYELLDIFFDVELQTKQEDINEIEIRSLRNRAFLIARNVHRSVGMSDNIFFTVQVFDF